MSVKVDDGIRNALTMLVRIGEGDSGGSGRCAKFLLSLWDGSSYHVDLQDMMYVDDDVFSAMMMIYQHLHGNNLQLDALISQDEMSGVLGMWGKD